MPYVGEDRVKFNKFVPISDDLINKAEGRLGYSFPDELRQFYQEIGAGVFKHTHDFSVIQKDHANRLLDPGSVADIKLLGYDSGQIVPDVEFKEGDLPFFEVGDGDFFLVMRPKSESPNLVYDTIGNLIEESFEKFIWRLYYESPIFYMANW